MSPSSNLRELILDIDEQLSDTKVDDRTNISEDQTEREQVVRYVLIGVGLFRLAIAIDDLSEIGNMPQLTSLPNLPLWIQGIVNVRSEVVSVMDLAKFINRKETKTCFGDRLAVIRYKKRKVGIRLDKIIATITVGMSEIKSLDSKGKQIKRSNLFSSGIQNEKEFYHILNVRRLLTSSQLIDYNNQMG